MYSLLSSAYTTINYFFLFWLMFILLVTVGSVPNEFFFLFVVWPTEFQCDIDSDSYWSESFLLICPTYEISEIKKQNFNVVSIYFFAALFWVIFPHLSGKGRYFPWFECCLTELLHTWVATHLVIQVVWIMLCERINKRTVKL